VVSFIGWAFETGVCFVQSGEFYDRGFLLLPFCPVYGAPVCLIYLLFGRPSDGFFYRLIERKKQKLGRQVCVLDKILSIFAYFLTAMAIATLGELIVGIVLENNGVSLWSYGGKFSYKGLVCLPVSVAWGGLISLFSQFALPKIENLVARIPKKFGLYLSIFLWVAIGIDFALNWLYVMKNGVHFDVVEYFKRW
jgi:uncharacterized membrane protein